MLGELWQSICIQRVWESNLCSLEFYLGRECRAIWWTRVERGAVVRRVERLEIPQ